MSAQQVAVHAFAINKKGVARQCMRQRPLDIAPIKSALSILIVLFISNGSIANKEFANVINHFTNATLLHFILLT